MPSEQITEMVDCEAYSIPYKSASGEACQFSIIASIANPKHWMISIVRGTDLASEAQTVTLFVNPDFIDSEREQQNPLLSVDEDASSNIQASGGRRVEDLFELFEILESSLDCQPLFNQLFINNNLLFKEENYLIADTKLLTRLQQLNIPDSSDDDDEIQVHKDQPIQQSIPPQTDDKEDESLFTKAIAIAAKIAAVGIPAAIGAVIGSIFIPGVGTIIGGIIGGGGAAALGLSGVGLYELYKKNSGIGTGLTVTGSAGVGAAVGAILGSFIPIPGVGTLAGMVIGAGVGFAVGIVIGAGIATFGKWLPKEPWERESPNVLGNPSDYEDDSDSLFKPYTKQQVKADYEAKNALIAGAMREATQHSSGLPFHSGLRNKPTTQQSEVVSDALPNKDFSIF